MGDVLSDIRVADFSWAAVGPLTTKYLADYGATVVRVESRKQPCVVRTVGPYKDNAPGLNLSTYFAYLNGNKYSMALDLTIPEGKEIAKSLVEWADVVVESFAPGVMEKLGLGYEDLKSVKNDIIMLRTSNQGQTGPHGSHPGYGYHMSGLCGFPEFTGWPDREPIPFPIAYTDIIAPRFAATSLIAALVHRNKTGEGQCLDISQLETSIYFMGDAVLDYTVNGREAGRSGNSHPHSAPHGVFRCKGEDSWCTIAVSSDEEWRGLKKTMGEPSWCNDGRFETFHKRKENESELNSLLERWTEKKQSETVMRLLQEEGVPSGVVKDAQQLREDAQLEHRDFLWELEHDEIGTCLHLGQAAILSETPATGRMAAPPLGQHTHMVCSEFLGMSDERFAELFAAGVFE